MEELEREATGRLSSTNFSFGRMNLDDKSSEMAAYLLATYKPNLLTLHLLAVDASSTTRGETVPRCHGLWPLSTEALPVWSRPLNRPTSSTEPRSWSPVTTASSISTRGGAQCLDGRSGIDGGERRSGRLASHCAQHQRGGLFVLADPEDQESLNKAREVLDAQPAEVRSLFKVLERADLDRLQSAPDAALGLTPVPGAYISSRYEPPAVRPIDGASHGYLPDIPEMYTGFVAWGAGIRPGARSP